MSDKRKIYRNTHLVLWLLVSALFVADRFYTNFWPRQTICAPYCGNDFFCDVHDAPGCLKAGPWTVKLFDAIARASARIIITTTNLMFLTMCHGTWNFLSEIGIFRAYLYNWRNDNLWLHAIGGWTMGAWIIAHVYSLMLPSMFSGFRNEARGGPWRWPGQVSLDMSQIDIDLEVSNWGYDDIWRLCWMTVMFGGLFPLSRSAWALRKNFSLSMWLHMFLGGGVFIDSFRRTTHPHVWILNTPFVIWYVLDRIWCATSHRVKHSDAVRIKLDKDYVLVLWNQGGAPKRICDIFWLKERDFSGLLGNGEMPHPFTTCSAHHAMITTGQGDESTGAHRQPAIELPLTTDVSWPGHRFSLSRGITKSKDPGLCAVDSLAEADLELFGVGYYNDSSPASDDTATTTSSIDEQKIGDRAKGNGLDNKLQSSVSSDDGPRLVRLSTPHFHDHRATFAENGSRTSAVKTARASSWDTMAIVRVQRRRDARVRKCSCMGITFVQSTYRQPATARLADLESADRKDHKIPVTTYGPYRSEYGRLSEFPKLPPLLVIASGAGAGLVLDFFAHIVAKKLTPINPVRICYSAASLPLLQMVTNNLLARKITGVQINTALTSHKDLELEDGDDPEVQGQLAIDRLDIKTIVSTLPKDAEVYFCGAGGINKTLRALCHERCISYTGSSV